MVRVGIVLKQLSSYKIAILDRDRGRIDGIVSKPICVGSLIHYSVDREYNHSAFIAQHSITDLPFVLARHDVLFWHHILELCFYFVPIGYHTQSLFELLQYLYTVDTSMRLTIQSKKLYLFKLLAAIGLYEALPQLVPEARVHQLLALPLAYIIDESLDEKSERIVNEWLRTCIAQHPKMEHFNTVHFLGNMENHE